MTCGRPLCIDLLTLCIDLPFYPKGIQWSVLYELLYETVDLLHVTNLVITEQEVNVT